MEDFETATEISSVEEIGQKTLTGKSGMAKPAGRFNPTLLLALLLVATAVSGGLYLFRLQRQTEELRGLMAGLRKETAAKTQTIGALNQELKKREESLQQSKGEADRWRGEAETLRLALNQKEGEVAELQKMASIQSKAPKSVQALRSRLAQKELENIRLQRAADDQSALVRLLSSPATRIIRLSGSQEGGAAGGVVLFDSNQPGAFFYGYNLPKLPAGKTYQLWAMTDKAAPVGTFQSGGDRTALMKMPKMARPSEVKRFAVTVEPAGGKARPTGPTYLAGEVAGAL